jgi:hypothetical protein
MFIEHFIQDIDLVAISSIKIKIHRILW